MPAEDKNKQAPADGAEKKSKEQDELDKLARGHLGLGGEDEPEPDGEDAAEGPAPGDPDSPPYFGMENLSFEEAEQLAYKNLHAFGKELYNATADQLTQWGFGGAVQLFPGITLTDNMIKDLIYNELLKNREKYFVPPEKNPTAATDGESLYINPYFAAWLTPKELTFVLAHEINHIMLRHAGDSGRGNSFIYGTSDLARLKNEKVSTRRQGLFNFRHGINNIGADLVINDQLVKDRMGEMPKLKHGEKAGKPFVCYIPGYSDFSMEEAVVKFSDSVCRNGYEILHEQFTRVGVDVKPPKYKKITNMAEARDELEVLYNYIYANAEKYLEQNRNQGGSDPKQGGQNGLGGPGGSGGGGQGSLSGQGGQSAPSRQSGQGGKQGQDEMDRTARGYIAKAINDALAGISADMTLDEIAKAIADAIANGGGGGGTVDQHDLNESLIEKIARAEGRDPSEIDGQIEENSSVLASKIIDKLQNMGVDPKQIKGIGCIGSNMFRKWHARQIRTQRPYDAMLVRLFKLIRGSTRDTYAKYNKKTTVINKALKNYAAKTGGAPSRVIIPNKLSEAGKLVVAIDTSGSIFGDSKSMTMAVEEILRITDMLNRKYTGSAIEVLMCDVDLHVYGEANTKYEMQKILKRVKDEGVEMQGGGGTDLLPIWTHVLEGKNEARKKGKMPPAGLIVVTDTETMNIEKITDLYYSHKFTVPTVILTTSDEIESCKIWRELSEKCSIFMMADIDKIKEKERQLRQAADMQER